MTKPPEEIVRQTFSRYLVLNRSMVGLGSIKTADVNQALETLVSSGEVKSTIIQAGPRLTEVFFLAENEDLVDAFLERQKK